MNKETRDRFDEMAVVEIEETELEIITAVLREHAGRRREDHSVPVKRHALELRDEEKNMNHSLTSEKVRSAIVEIEEVELEAIAAALRVRSGLQAGAIRTLIPCL